MLFCCALCIHASSNWMTALRAGVWTVLSQSLRAGIDGNLHSSRMQTWTHTATQVMVHWNPIALVCEFWWARGGVALFKGLYSRPHVHTALSICAKLLGDGRHPHIRWATTFGRKQIREQKHALLRVFWEGPLGESGTEDVPVHLWCETNEGQVMTL